MNLIKIPSRFFLVVLVFILSAITGYAADRITIIQNPLSSRPAIVQAGGNFTITCKAASSAQNWAATISSAYNQAPLQVIPQYDNTIGMWKITATVPVNTPFELYHLKVTAQGLEDQVSHAVKVITGYKNSYYFIHLPDLHLPAVSWVGYYDDANTIPEYLKVIRELEIINPEFVLQTGDFVDNGQQASSYELAQSLLDKAQVPMFITGGNHDLWYDGHNNWKKYFNPTMDYSFNYGSHHYAGMEMFDIPSVTFTAGQMQWLQNDLQASVKRNDRMRTLFYHYDESRQIDADFVDDYLVDLILYGHTHINAENRLGTRPTLNLNTSFTMNNHGQYRLVKIAGDQVQAHPVIDFNKLNVRYTPANDGTNLRVKAIIQNANPVAFENGLIKFLVRESSAGYTVTGGTVAQIIDAGNYNVYYVHVNIGASSQQDVLIQCNNALGNNPPEITSFSPRPDAAAIIPLNMSIIAGAQTTFSIQAQDPDGNPLQYRWYLNNSVISGANGAQYNYTPNKTFTGMVELKARVMDAEYYDEITWPLEVEEYTDKPKLASSVVSFYLQNIPMTINWIEPKPITARFEYGTRPGVYTGSIVEDGANQVSFTPAAVGMGLGVHYCRITDGQVSSEPFTIIIESPIAPQMQAPIGNITDLAPEFTWDRVPGVPYYMVICSDQEIIIAEDPVTREFTVEGANPIWSMLTSENRAHYGDPDPSGTYTSAPSPLIPGASYWWVVLNCYGNAAEMTSPVQSGISRFKIDLPAPNLAAPQLLAPAGDVVFDDEMITFSWNRVENAKMYHFYPYKIENELGIESARAVWQNIIATTATSYDYPAAQFLMKGRYRWKVAAVSESGLEIMSTARDFYYNAPAAVVSITTFDDLGTPEVNNDDKVLPRVTITYTALSGVYNNMPLSTDLHGRREGYNISPGDYRFVVKKEGYNTITDTLTFVTDQTCNLVFRLSPSKSKIVGRVVDKTGNPVNDVLVTAQHSLLADIVKNASTDGQGNFSLSVLPGPFQVFASKDGYQNSATQTISLVSGENKSLDADLVITKNNNTLSGFVVNEQQQPVFGVQVTIHNSVTYTKATNANGYFEFTVPDGDYLLAAEKQGFISPPQRTVAISGGREITISPSLVLQANASIIRGVVSDGTRQIPGAEIKAFPQAGSPLQTTSDTYGQFNFNTAPGIYTLSATKPGYSLASPVQVTAQSGITQSGINLDLTANQCIINGKVTIDGYTPLGGVVISNSGMSTLTTDGGSYSLGINAGTHVIFAFKEGFSSAPPETIAVVPGQTLEQVNFVLSPNASVIKGRIIADGNGVYNARVEAVNSHTVVTTSDEQGYYVLNLESGSWNIRAIKSGFTLAEMNQVPVGVGQTVSNINLEMQSSVATITGLVTNSNTGEALKNVQVQVPALNISTMSADNGVFSMSVNPGNHLVTAVKAGFGAAPVQSGALAANQTATLAIKMVELSSNFVGVIKDVDNNLLPGVTVVARSAVDSFYTVTGQGGSYRLDTKPGVWQVAAMLDGYKPAIIYASRQINANQTINAPEIKLAPDRGIIAGTVIRLLNSNPIPLARVTAKKANGFTAQTQSDNNGNYRFVDEANKPILHSGVYNIYITKTGFTSDTLYNINVESDKVVDVDAVLQKNDAVINGTVTCAGEPVSGATVTAQSITSRAIFNAISQEDGSYQVKNLLAGEYQLRVACVGYSSPDPITIMTGSANELILIRNRGRFCGYVRDNENNKAIAGVTVTADDEHGNNGTAKTNNQGYFNITTLPQLYNYKINFTISGYTPLTWGPEAATDSSFVLAKMNKIYGNISGVVKNNAGAAMAGVIVNAVSASISRVDTTESDGRFSFVRLPGDQYSVTAQQPGYACDPIQQLVSLWQGGTINTLEFTMLEAIAARIKIIGPDNINNKTTQKYYYSAQTSDGREASIEPIWQVDFSAGVEQLAQNGTLDPHNDFIGALQLKLQDSFSGISATQNVFVTQELVPGNTNLNISNKRGVHLAIQDSCVNQNIVLQFRRPELAEAMKSSKKYQIVGDIYQFTPVGFSFLKPVTLSLPVPEGKSAQSLTIGKWNSTWLQWEAVENIDRDEQQLNVTIQALGRFAIMEKAEPLSIRNIQFLPNPFSPLAAPLEIKYYLTSEKTENPLVTITIYNMIGDLVKTLVDSEFRKRGEVTEMWDGITNHGRMALNGRYLIHFRIKDSSGEKEELKTFVLIK